MIRRRVNEKRRVPPTLHVQWPGVFEIYARKWVVRQGWRVAHTVGDRDDALQECALVFAKCHKRYRYVVDNPAWFMSLYKVALLNHWNTLAVRDGRARAMAVPDVIETTDPAQGPLLAALHGASDELQQVLCMIANAPAELMGILFGNPCDTITNRRLRRWSGIGKVEQGACLVSELRNLLSSEN